MSESLSLSAINRAPRLYETVSVQLVTAIREAGLTPGSKIPTERELCDQFGVSRTVIREAIRHLVAKRVLDASIGGAPRVASPSHEGISESLETYISLHGDIEPHKISEVRETLELSTARLAAERATPEQIRQIRSACDSLAKYRQAPEDASRADVAFHRAIAGATNNELYLVLVDSLGDVLLHIRRATLGDPDRVDATVAEHRRIIDAIEDGDPESAVAAMHDHLIDSSIAYRSTVDASATQPPGGKAQS